MKRIMTILFTVTALMLASCVSNAKIPDNATSTQLIQLGQDAMEVSNYTAAEQYYMAVIQRYGMDTATYIEARYELGHLYLKKKDYTQAYECFSEIVEIFENAEIGYLPAAYKKLAQMGLSNIPNGKLTKIQKAE